MTTDVDNPFDEPTLLGVPVMRAAYSDRTAWLMSAMSELAYYRFEDSNAVFKLAEDLAKLNGVKAIEERLKSILDVRLGGGNEETLKTVLKIAGFELLQTYNRDDTQAFLAKRTNKEGSDMLVLAFRGTEMTPRDIHSDVNAKLTTLNGEEKVHSGFLKAFNHVHDAIADDLVLHKGIPVYITGHSLGGALAILATRLLASDSQGACYTFGGPRVGNATVDDQIKTPIYRIVNAADLVPRVPPAYIVGFFITIANLLHFTFISSFLRRFKGYVHYGDMRYLNHVEPGSHESFPGLALHSNPSFPVRIGWVVRRWIATLGKAGGTDHSISLYRKKLKAYALSRKNVGKR
ncbi:MAG: lipase family protein [Rhodobacteraceae bacterium]|nr:lipase family protein [Paracoccaceae bacterium]